MLKLNIGFPIKYLFKSINFLGEVMLSLLLNPKVLFGTSRKIPREENNKKNREKKWKKINLKENIK